MKNLIKILVIEDRANHIADAKQMFEDVKSNLPVEFEVLYAVNLASAMSLIANVDCVMTDVFFPDVIDGEEKPNGQTIVEHCLNMEKPVVWVTSTYHHSKKTQPLYAWGRIRGICLFDCSVGTHNNDSEGEHKLWKEALFGLLSIMIGLEMKLYMYKYDLHHAQGIVLMQVEGENDTSRPGPLRGTNMIQRYLAMPVKNDFLIYRVVHKMQELGFNM
ncbi:hypothetical protein A3C09_02225 [Candidatus Uhrbacteria bacterium RIFCSPHIGHO2_02_FULL_47_44]|uniref:Response regulatory domain-containing protein n=1 Tax=Candidatus Uhrbacteria bacterium RIFCSPLOWO2_02_FULL_48_18 TaxID=1802408 RepID=A0A1F7V6Y4_9BACT|nr:MAG: hypothetical protein A2839_05390 [Candidatus Uhrbacteria bacterium RIFCSPHIGHO2_01_FULL_47_10]OGL70872.1 MAG: hypothetical protein A3C09_02225 [Candidatus Uhrbacteria bacterium RIFCSPHIGHO2_02_FULL_47_44]OGL77595.1 MAG: hypothetical protein A3E97_04940 [Candidatus Uhrbacteria bacterium RIFCSPHIGHO2_12_FULL_47_12]OGL80419.1 MAG: hypothetical protein A3B20_03320 [Candidatus Uhrbacteria bacterium RIFCSPLOWO2_01_FULL_47_17]OGL86279.1 MAG: hypothetical protein A3I41_01805 [Candidatus Uhrbact